MKTTLLFLVFIGTICFGYSQTYDAFEPNESFATSSPINICSNYNATIGELGDTDYYSINVTNGQYIHIGIFQIPTGVTLKVTIYDNSNIELANWTGSGSISETYTPSFTSSIYIKIESITNNYSDVDYLFYTANSSCGETDGDGLLDTTEINVTLTNPYDRDTDDDGFTDSKEVYTYGLLSHFYYYKKRFF